MSSVGAFSSPVTFRGGFFSFQYTRTVPVNVWLEGVHHHVTNDDTLKAHESDN